MNKVIVIGNLTKEIELKKTNTDKSVVNFSLAVNENDKAEFIDFQAWEKTAELIAKYVTKGQKLLVEGKIRTSTYEGQTGKVKKTFVLVDRVEFLSSKPSTETTEKKDAYVEIKSEDLPFY